MSNSNPKFQVGLVVVDVYASPVFSILKVLEVTVKFILKDSEEKKTTFNPRPYFSTLDPVFDGANLQVLTALASSFHVLQPLKIPAFSFVWLELVSHRSFMPKLLSGNAQKGWPYFQRLLVDLFQFMEPFLRKTEVGEPIDLLAEISQSPRILSEVDTALKAK
ncbi:transcription regulator [Artemisia annua]|uniref:Transcription regulator n=1 Tax=Artemisia annua TaxID=35608 RepID=A0A2U1LSF4_ARTAN|nr:transcription regulator [Artemisia annua]